MEKVIIFDGEQSHDIGIEYFFQHPVIERIGKSDIVHYYKATAIFRDTLKQVIKAHKVNESTTESIKHYMNMLNQVTGGENMLRIMLKDLVGDEVGSTVILLVEQLIKEDNENV